MELIAHVTKLPLQDRKLRCQVGLGEVVFSYDEKYVTIESKHNLDSGVRKYDLWRLIATPATEQMHRPEASTQTRSGIAFLLAAAVVFFSEFRWALPLLVPVLVLVGLVELAIGWNRLRPRTFTHFFGSDGLAIVSIPTKIIEGDREAFIQGLAEAIRSARTAVFGTTAV
jgi:hypothetical protein